MNLMLEAVDEARTDRAVDHACGKGALLGRTSLTLEVAAGNAADGVHLLDVVDGQREEVVIFLFLRNDGSHQDGGVPLSAQHSTRSLLGKFARFQTVLLAVELEGLDDFLHVVFFSFFVPSALLLMESSSTMLLSFRIATTGKTLALPAVCITI